MPGRIQVFQRMSSDPAGGSMGKERQRSEMNAHAVRAPILKRAKRGKSRKPANMRHGKGRVGGGFVFGRKIAKVVHGSTHCVIERQNG